MDYNPNIEIKKEKVSVAERLCFDDDDNFLDFELDINLKVENVLLNEGDWSITDDYNSASYEELLEDQKQTCLICNHFFPNSFLLLQHNLEHFHVPLVNRKVFICDYCFLYYKKKNDLEVHIRKMHMFKPKKYYKKAKLYNCSQCKRKNMFYKAWHAHMNNVHAKTNVTCGECTRIFKCDRYLKRHILYVHKGERPEWRFHSKKDEIMTKEIKCPLCPGVYTNKTALKTHTRNCHSDKRYQCQLCNSMLKSRPYLLAHMLRVHYDDGQTYRCEICYKKFRSPRYLNTHINNIHAKHKKSLNK